MRTRRDLLKILGCSRCPDVETGGAIEKKELPLVVGIMADLSGNPSASLPAMKDRRFVEIDRDNFDGILRSIAPRLALQADNTLQKDGSKLNVELNFASMNDFDPVNVIRQVAPLRRLFEARLKLRDLLTKLDGNDDLDSLLQKAARNEEELRQLAPPEEAAAKKKEKESGKGPERRPSARTLAAFQINRRRPPQAFLAVLKSVLDVDAVILPFHGRWHRLPAARQSRPGRGGANAVLGRNAVVGRHVWDQHAGLQLLLGPLDRRRYHAFQPDGAERPQLEALLDAYFGPDLEIRIRPQLADHEREKPVLKNSHAPPLGRSWL